MYDNTLTKVHIYTILLKYVSTYGALQLKGRILQLQLVIYEAITVLSYGRLQKKLMFCDCNYVFVTK